MREAVIVNALRTAVGKAPRGKLKDTRPDDLAAVAEIVGTGHLMSVFVPAANDAQILELRVNFRKSGAGVLPRTEHGIETATRSKSDCRWPVENL